MKSLKAKIEKHPYRNVPRRIFDIEHKPSKDKPENIAESVLKKIAPDLKIKADLSQLKFDQVKESILGKHVLYQQQFQGKPISGAWIRVDIDNEGKIYNIMNGLLPQPAINKAAKTLSNLTVTNQDTPSPQLTSDEAKKIAIEAIQPSTATLNDIMETELVYYPQNNIPILSWKILLTGKEPRGEYKIYLNAMSGAIIDKINLLKYVDGMGQVFDPNPVVVLNDTSLEDTSVIPDQAYTKVTLKDLKNTGMLDGPFVSTSTTRHRVKRTDLKFIFKRDNPGAFKEVMVYFHIDRAQRYIQSLGFSNVLNSSIKVDVDGTTDDNSSYNPFDQSLTFGTGGVDDAEDAEIILHEYGHAIQDNQLKGFGQSAEGAAMGEGFGDYFAASFFSDKKSAIFKPTIGNWDAVASGAEPPCLRRLDSNKKYPKDMTGEEHNDGEIWSACLWEIRGAIGRTTADKIIIAHHFLLDQKAGFEDAANALITADKNLNQGRNSDVIRSVFTKRGIFPNPKRKNKRAGDKFETATAKQ